MHHICGGGAIGVAIAYFLSRRGAQPERHAVAGAASGKSGGFIALDWCRGSPLDRLARRSFELHAELAADLGNPWGYQRLATYAGYAAENDIRGPGPRPWLSESVRITGQLGSLQTTALIEPHAFTTGLMRAAEAHGATVKPGAVVNLRQGPGGAAGSVVLDTGETVEGDVVIIAMGPWSMLATRWLPLPAVFGHKGHSLVLETGKATPAEALFLEYQEASGATLSPEVFPRANGTTWVCAISSTAPMPIDPADVAPDEGAHERLELMCRNISPALADAPDRSAADVFSAGDRGWAAADWPSAGRRGLLCGHRPQRLGHAQCARHRMAELILDGAAHHVDLLPSAPGRLPTFDPTFCRTARTS